MRTWRVKFLESDDYRELVNDVASKRAQREQTILKPWMPLENELKRAGIEGVPRSLACPSTCGPSSRSCGANKGFEEIYDLMAIRASCGSVPECYHVLGIIHHNWTPIQERIKDYIAAPKSNAYQSLHTTIFGCGRRGVRGPDPHRGDALHRRVRHRGRTGCTSADGKPDELDQHLGWFRQLLELQQDTHSPGNPQTPED